MSLATDRFWPIPARHLDWRTMKALDPLRPLAVHAIEANSY